MGTITWTFQAFFLIVTIFPFVNLWAFSNHANFVSRPSSSSYHTTVPTISSSKTNPFSPSTHTNTFLTHPTLTHTVIQMSMTNNANPPPYPVRVAVMGGGNFGLALATVVARKNIPTTLLVRDEDIVQRLNTEHKHPRYMSDITLPKLIRATSDPERALSDATYIIHTVPCQFSRE